MLDDLWKILQEAQVGHHSPFEATLCAAGFHSRGPCSSRFSPPVSFSFLFLRCLFTLDAGQVVGRNVCPLRHRAELPIIQYLGGI